MPQVKRGTHQPLVVVFDEVLVTGISISRKDADSGVKAPKYFYLDCIINGDKTQVTVTGLDEAGFNQWCSIPPLPLKVQTELRFGSFTNEDGTKANITFHQPHIMGMADSAAAFITPNGKKASS